MDQEGGSEFETRFQSEGCLQLNSNKSVVPVRLVCVEGVLYWLLYQALAVWGSVIGLVSLVSVYCDWVRL